MKRSRITFPALLFAAACGAGGQSGEAVRAARPERAPSVEDLGGAWRVEGEADWLFVVDVTYGAAYGNPDATLGAMPLYVISETPFGDEMTHLFEAPNAPAEASFGADVYWTYDEATDAWRAGMELFAFDELDSPDQVRLPMEGF